MDGGFFATAPAIRYKLCLPICNFILLKLTIYGFLHFINQQLIIVHDKDTDISHK